MKRVIAFLFFLALAGSLFAADSKTAPQYPAGTNACFKGPVGLQLYSIRDVFKKDLDEGMKMTRDWGITYVEVTTIVRQALPPEQLLKKFNQYGLKGDIAHFPYDQWKKDPEGTAQQAAALKLKYSGTASIPCKEKFLSEEKMDEAAKVFNKAAEALNKYGIKFIYHNHGKEFGPWTDGTLFDKLIQNTTSGKVFFEMDILWTILPGENPIRLFKKYPNRFAACHVKDHQGSNYSVTLGTGETDFAPILKAAQEAGVKYFFIEDESKNAVKQIPQTIKFLETIKW